MQQVYLWGFTVLGILTVAAAAPQPHHRDGAIDPVIEFLKQLRKARKHSGGGILGNREEDGASSQQGGFNTQSQQSQQVVPILFPSGGGSSSGGNSGLNSQSSPNDQRITLQIPANFPITPSPTSSPQDIQRINSGVSTILNGVRSFDLGQILRGAFIFPQNNNVKSVANNVLDTIFGPIGGGGGGSSSAGGDAPFPPTRN